MVTNSSAVLQVPFGYWRNSDSSNLLLPCPYPLACTGGNSSGIFLCAEGYTGVLCGEAAEKSDFIDWTSREVESCSTESVALAVILTLCSFSFLVYLSCCSIKEALPFANKKILKRKKHDSDGEEINKHVFSLFWHRCMHSNTANCDSSVINDESSIEDEDSRDEENAFRRPPPPPPPPKETLLDRFLETLRDCFVSQPTTQLLPKRALRKLHYYQAQEYQLRQQMQLYENESHQVYIWIARVKMLIFYLQICSILPNIFALQFPEHSTNFMRMASFVSLSSLQSLPWTCFGQSLQSSGFELNFLLIMELSTLLPALVMMLLSGLAMLYYEVCYYCYDTEELSATDQSVTSPSRRQEIHLQRQWSHELLIQRYVTSLSLLFYVSLGGIANSLFQSFTCIYIEEDNGDRSSPLYSVLWTDVSVSCQSSLYFYSKVWAILAALLFLGFIPAVHMLILSIFRNSIKEHYHAWSALLLQGFNIQDLWNHVHLYKEKVMQTSTGALKTMFWGFRESCSGWELVEHLYRVGIMALVPFYRNRSIVQFDSTDRSTLQYPRMVEISPLLLALFFSMLYLLGLVYWKPFYLSSQQVLAECAMFHIIVLVLCALTLKLQLVSSDNSEFDLILLLVLLVTPLYAVLQTCLFYVDPLLNAKQSCPATILLLPESANANKGFEYRKSTIEDDLSGTGSVDDEEAEEEMDDGNLLQRRSLQAFPSFYEYMYYMQDYETHYQRMHLLQQKQSQDAMHFMKPEKRMSSRKYASTAWGRKRSKQNQVILTDYGQPVISSESDSTGTTFDQVLLHKYELKQLKKKQQTVNDEECVPVKGSEERMPSFTGIMPSTSAKLRNRCRLSYGNTVTNNTVKKGKTTTAVTVTEDWNHPLAGSRSRSLFDYHQEVEEEEEAKEDNHHGREWKEQSPAYSMRRDSMRTAPSTPNTSKQRRQKESDLEKHGKGTKDTQDISSSYSDSKEENEEKKVAWPALQFPHLPIHAKQAAQKGLTQSMIRSDSIPPSPSSSPPQSPRDDQRGFLDSSPPFEFNQVYRQPSSISSHELRPPTPSSASRQVGGSRTNTPMSKIGRRTPLSIARKSRNSNRSTPKSGRKMEEDDPPCPALEPAEEIQSAGVINYSCRYKKPRPQDLSKVLQLVKRFEGDSSV